MTLRRKILIAIGLTLAGLIAITGIAAHYVLLTGFANLEKTEVRRNLDRAADVIGNELQTLGTMAGDYAVRYEKHAFVEDRNESYVESNLAQEMLARPRLNTVIFADAAGRIVHAGGIDPRTGQEVEAPSSLLRALAAYPSLLRHQAETGGKTGLLALSGWPMMIASHPIRSGEDGDSIRGAVLVGRYLDAAEIERLSHLMHLIMTIGSYDGIEAESPGGTDSKNIEPLGNGSIAGWIALKDVFGRPTFKLAITMGRDIFQQGRNSLTCIMIYLIVTGMVVTAVVMILTEKLLLARLGALSASVERIGHTADLDRRVPAGGGDELATLARAINDMLENLSESQVELVESEEHSRALVEELRVKHRQLLQIIESLPDPTFVIDREGKVIAWNQAIEELTGIQKQDILGRGDYAYAVPFHGEARPTLIDLVGREDQETESQYEIFVRKAGTIYAETSITGAHGQRAYLWLTASPLYDDKGNLMGAIESIRDITERRQVEEKLKYLGLHDPLTGLRNRAYFEEEMRRLEEENHGPVGLILCDIDGLKLVNDTFGHGAGDKVLLAAARVIQEPFLEEGTVARIGGDEFAILLAGWEQARLDAGCHRIRDGIAAYNADHPELPLSVSLGSAAGTPSTRPLNELFREADNNVYREKLHRIRSARSAIVAALMKALEARDFISADHADRLQDLCGSLAEAAGLTERRLDDLRLFAQFHDIGKVGIPDRILFKSSRLTAAEDQEMQRHSEIGFRIAQSAPDLAHIADWILKHHEWWNGGGYPLGLKGTEIPLECRILAIADAYDAMISDRPYRKALTRDRALAELRRDAGERFDPELVALFFQVLADKRTNGGGTRPD